MSAAEAREDEHARRAPDQPADVAPDRDTGEHEAQREVDHDQPHRTAAEHVRALALENQGGAENPEDRARGADGHRRGRENKRAGRAGEARDQING